MRGTGWGKEVDKRDLQRDCSRAATRGETRKREASASRNRATDEENMKGGDGAAQAGVRHEERAVGDGGGL